jgi:hypothetical protein
VTEPHHGPEEGLPPTPHHAHEGGSRHAAPGPADLPPFFEEEEWKQFQRSDLGACKVVVALMAGIFVTGLLMYSAIAYIAY